MISEGVKIEEESYKIKAGRWRTWEPVVNRSITWANVEDTPHAENRNSLWTPEVVREGVT